MASFTYQARDPAGKSVAGDVEALDEQTAATQLMDRGLMVVTLRRGVARKVGKKRHQGKVKALSLIHISEPTRPY